MLASIGKPIGRFVRRVMLALVPPAGQADPDVPPVSLKYPMF